MKRKEPKGLKLYCREDNEDVLILGLEDAGEDGRGVFFRIGESVSVYVDAAQLLRLSNRLPEVAAWLKAGKRPQSGIRWADVEVNE